MGWAGGKQEHGIASQTKLSGQLHNMHVSNPICERTILRMDSLQPLTCNEQLQRTSFAATSCQFGNLSCVRLRR